MPSLSKKLLSYRSQRSYSDLRWKTAYKTSIIRQKWPNKKWKWDHKYWPKKNENSTRRRLSKNPLDSKEIKPVNPKGNKPWIFIRSPDAEAPILWQPDAKSQLFGKDPDAGKDWRQKEKGVTDDEMVGWHHWLKGHEFEQAPGAGDGQGDLACCSLWGRKELDTTEQLNWTELMCWAQCQALEIQWWTGWI